MHSRQLLLGWIISCTCLCAPAARADVLGEVTFDNSCSTELQTQFNRAVALLHSFEYDEARAEFSAVQTADPSCAIAAWGLAMTDYHPLWAVPTPTELERGAAAVFRTPPLAAKTEREQGFIQAMQAFYDGPTERPHPQRVAAYEAAMSQLYAQYPNDAEVGIFYALALDAAADPLDKTYAKQRQAIEILQHFAVDHPEHPGIAHYVIHSCDNPELAKDALEAAREYAEIAPESAHAQHMPSHIFTRLGLWDEAIDANVRATAAAREHAAEHGIAAAAWDEELHGMDYLEYAYLQVGQDQAAAAVLDHLNHIDTVSPVNLKSAYAFAAIPARYALERRRWTEAAAITLHPTDYPWASLRQFEAISIFARAYGKARLGRTEEALSLVAQLTEIESAVRATGDAFWADAVKVQALLVSAWLAYKPTQTNEEALELARTAADLEDLREKHPVTPGQVVPAREALAELLALSAQPEQALQEYRIVLLMEPNRLQALRGAARAASMIGDHATARSYYQTVLDNCKNADAGHSAVWEASLFLFMTGSSYGAAHRLN